MSTVKLNVSAELLANMLQLGPHARIVGAVYEFIPDRVELYIDDRDAPEGATEFTPSFIRNADGSSEMIPRYR